jgi:hypothetical protein
MCHATKQVATDRRAKSLATPHRSPCYAVIATSAIISEAIFVRDTHHRGATVSGPAPSPGAFAPAFPGLASPPLASAVRHTPAAEVSQPPEDHPAQSATRYRRRRTWRSDPLMRHTTRSHRYAIRPSGKSRASRSAWPAIPLCQKSLDFCAAFEAIRAGVLRSSAIFTKRMEFSGRKTCVGKRLSCSDKPGDVRHNSPADYRAFAAFASVTLSGCLLHSTSGRTSLFRYSDTRIRASLHL